MKESDINRSESQADVGFGSLDEPHRVRSWGSN